MGIAHVTVCPTQKREAEREKERESTARGEELVVYLHLKKSIDTKKREA
jgi:hypothetical protein